MERSVYALVRTSAQRTPEAIAVAAPARPPLRYARLLEHVDSVVARLRSLGVGRADRIALAIPPGPEMALAFVSVAACATAAPVNPGFRGAEFEFALSDLGARAVVTLAGWESPVREVARMLGLRVIDLRPGDAEPGLFTLEETRLGPASDDGLPGPDELALVLHTSGTTAKPKRVPLTQSNVFSAAQHIAGALELTPADRCLNVMPLFHIAGLMTGTLATLHNGASMACPPGFEVSEFYRWMASMEPTWYIGSPTMHQAILARAPLEPEALAKNRLRLIRSLASILPPTLRKQIEETLGAPIVEAYSLTEACGVTTSNPIGAGKSGSIGKAVGCEVTVLGDDGGVLGPGEIGELAVRGPSVMRGYEDAPEANASAFVNGWFRTGDQGYRDADGFFFVTGRLKEIINRGGEKVAPAEIDEALLQHPAVAQVAAFGVPDARLGESIAAAVVLRDPSVQPRELQDFAAARLADYKVPAKIIIVDEIPKSAANKIQRRLLPEKLGLTTQTASPDVDDLKQPEGDAEASPVEEFVRGLWLEVLRLGEIPAGARFFDLGGDSLAATRLLARIREQLSVDVPIHRFFEAPTIAALTNEIEEALLSEGVRA